MAAKRGEWIGAAGWPEGGDRGAVVDLLGQATAGTAAHDFVAIAGRVFLIVSEPARFADEIVGTLTVGYALTDDDATRLAQETHCDVSLVSGRTLYATSLDRPTRELLVQQLTAIGHELSGHPVPTTIGSRQYVGGQFLLVPDAQDGRKPQLLLLEDWAPVAKFIGAVRRGVVGAGVIVLAVALGFGVVASRHVTRPLRELALAAGDVAGGNWARQITVTGSAETVTMAESFNAMTTNLRHWYEEARRRDDQLRQAQKLEAIGRLAGGVAHDFNNLLTAMHGYAELVIERLDERHDLRDDVLEIIKAADRAAGLTKQLLSFSRRQVVSPQVIELDAVVAGAERLLTRLLGEDMRLEMVVPSKPWRVFADTTQIEQVLINLAVNARDAMPSGGTLRIELTNVVFDASTGRPTNLATGRYVRLSVSDSGTGMDAETLSHIFEPFFTTKDDGRGTGLGLATVYGVVEQAGGAIDVDSKEGVGTTFHVFLPESSEPASAQNVAITRESEPPAGASETVLLVEDDADVRRFIAAALTDVGYTVLEAPDPHQALRNLHNLRVADSIARDGCRPAGNERPRVV